MLRRTEYDFLVRLLNRAIGAGLPVVVLALGFVVLSATADAQINGMPASVTSPGFGGRQVNGVAPSVTSLGPRGYTPGSPTCCFRGTTPPKGFTTSHPSPDFRHHEHNGNLAWGGVYAAPYYGYYDSSADVANDPSGDQYSGGPTIFDRRGSGAAPAPSASYPARSGSYSPQRASTDPEGQDESGSASDQPQTVLVFKDGHEVEVANYAIVGSTLYDLSSGHRLKIALNDLDLSATAKENGDRGIDFQLPSKSEAN